MISSQTTSLRTINSKTGENRNRSALNPALHIRDGQSPQVRYVVYCKVPIREQAPVQLPTFIEIASDPSAAFLLVEGVEKFKDPAHRTAA